MAPKFRRGETITDLGDLADWLKAGNWVYWGTRPKHPAFIVSMMFASVAAGVGAGIIAKAIANADP